MCDSNGIHEGAAKLCVKHLTTTFATASLLSRLYLKCEKSLCKPEGVLSSRIEVVNHSLVTYASGEVIARTMMKKQNFKMTSTMAPIQTTKLVGPRPYNTVKYILIVLSSSSSLSDFRTPFLIVCGHTGVAMNCRRFMIAATYHVTQNPPIREASSSNRSLEYQANQQSKKASKQ